MTTPFSPSTPPPPPKSPGERRARPRFDTMKIWNDATAAILANREVLLAVLGVFSILPNFALQMLAPIPEPVSGQQAAQLLERLGAYFDTYWLPLSAVMVVQFFGMLVTLAVLADPARPTVRDAMRLSAWALPSFLAALVLALVGSFLTGMIPVTLIGLTGSLGLTQVAAVLGSVLILYLLVRFAFIGPAVLLGKQRNPVLALRGSLLATRGIGWQLLAFILLIFVAFRIVGWLITAAAVLVATLIAGATGAALIGALVACIVQAALLAVFVAVIAASFRQVSGPAA